MEELDGSEWSKGSDWFVRLTFRRDCSGYLVGELVRLSEQRWGPSCLGNEEGWPFVIGDIEAVEWVLEKPGFVRNSINWKYTYASWKKVLPRVY